MCVRVHVRVHVRVCVRVCVPRHGPRRIQVGSVRAPQLHKCASVALRASAGAVSEYPECPFAREELHNIVRLTEPELFLLDSGTPPL